jgi:hypothetical protein
MDKGNVAGFAYFTPKPAPDHAYAAINTPPCVAAAIADPLGENAILFGTVPSAVTGSAYCVPTPVASDHWKALMFGAPFTEVSNTELSGLNAIPLYADALVGRVYAAPNPETADHL